MSKDASAHLTAELESALLRELRSEWLNINATYFKGKLIPPVGRERAEIKTWEALADGLMDAAILARLEATWTGRTKAQRSQAWIDRQLSRVDAALVAMSKGLGDKPFCAGIHLTLADIAVGCALGYLDFRFPLIDWRGLGPDAEISINSAEHYLPLLYVLGAQTPGEPVSFFTDDVFAAISMTGVRIG